MTPLHSCEPVVVVEIPDQHAQVKCAFDGIKNESCAWQSESIWDDGAWHVRADQPVDFLIGCNTLRGASQRVEEGIPGHAKGVLVCYVSVVDVVDYLDQQVVVVSYRVRCHIEGYAAASIEQKSREESRHFVEET